MRSNLSQEPHTGSISGWELRDGQGSPQRLRVGCYDLAEDVTAEELGRLAPIFPPNPAGRAEAKRRFGVDLLPAAATELGSGQPFLRFFQTDREGHERGVLSVDPQARR